MAAKIGRVSEPRPIPIESIDDPRVDPFRNVRDADLRGRDHLFLAESELVIRRLLRTPQRVHSILLSPNKFKRMRDALGDLPESVPILVAPLGMMTEIAGFRIHRGALAAGLRPAPGELSFDRAIGYLRQRESFTLLLAENVTNVDNMGGLFRNAAAFGVDAIVLDPTCCDPLYRKAIRVSMGHAFSVPYAISDDWHADLRRLKSEWRATLIGAESAPGSRALWELTCSPRMALLFGSEGAGLSRNSLERCDAVHEIPMTQAVPSLNVAVASAVFLYELSRARRTRASGARGKPRR